MMTDGSSDVPHPASSLEVAYCDYVSKRSRQIPLQEPVRELVDEVADRLAAQLAEEKSCHLRDVEAKVLDESGLFDWSESQSQRVVARLGRTYRGGYVVDSQVPVVIKYIPEIRIPKFGSTAAPHKWGNHHALALYEYVLNREDGDLVAPILDAAHDGVWIAQREVLPLYYTGGPDEASMDFVCEAALDRDYSAIREFNSRAQDRGYGFHVKRGNVGYDIHSTQPQQVVYADLGGATSLPDGDY